MHECRQLDVLDKRVSSLRIPFMVLHIGTATLLSWWLLFICRVEKFNSTSPFVVLMELLWMDIEICNMKRRHNHNVHLTSFVAYVTWIREFSIQVFASKLLFLCNHGYQSLWMMLLIQEHEHTVHRIIDTVSSSSWFHSRSSSQFVIKRGKKLVKDWKKRVFEHIMMQNGMWIQHYV